MAEPVDETSWLLAVQNITQAVGEPKPATLASPNEFVSRAMSAVQYAADEVYRSDRWHFRLQWKFYTLVADNAWYLLPADFGTVFAHLPVYLGTRTIKYMDFEQIFERYPHIRTFPPDAGAPAEVITQFETASAYAGSAPVVYTATESYLGILPAPGSSYVEEQISLAFPYLRDHPLLSDGADLIDMPREWRTAVHHLALAHYKKDLNYQDHEWRGDEQKGQMLLQRLQVRRSTRGRANYRMKANV